MLLQHLCTASPTLHTATAIDACSYSNTYTITWLAALKKTLADFRSESQSVAATANVRITRNKVMIGPDGIYDTGTEVKEYIRSAFGIRSEATKEVSKLRLAA